MTRVLITGFEPFDERKPDLVVCLGHAIEPDGPVAPPLDAVPLDARIRAVRIAVEVA